MKNYTKSKVIIGMIGASCIFLSCIIPSPKNSNQVDITITESVFEASVDVIDLKDCYVGKATQVVETESSSLETTTCAPTTESESEMESETTIVEESSTEEVFTVPQYKVNGAVLDSALNEYLYYKLDEYGIAWWHQYALIQAYQESRFNIYSEAPNGLDKGLFQFRILYWASSCAQYGLGTRDIFDPYAQIDLYVAMVYSRLMKGWTEDEIISAHYTGGYGYSQSYVNEVRQWAQYIGQIN